MWIGGARSAVPCRRDVRKLRSFGAQEVFAHGAELRGVGAEGGLEPPVVRPVPVRSVRVHAGIWPVSARLGPLGRQLSSSVRPGLARSVTNSVTKRTHPKGPTRTYPRDEQRREP